MVLGFDDAVRRRAFARDVTVGRRSLAYYQPAGVGMRDGSDENHAEVCLQVNELASVVLHDCLGRWKCMAADAVLKFAIERFVESTMSKFAVPSLRRSQGLICGSRALRRYPLRHSTKSHVSRFLRSAMALSSAQLASCSAFVTQRRFFNCGPLIRVCVYTHLDSIGFTY